MRDNFKLIGKIADVNSRERERLTSLGIDFSLFNNCYILPGFTDVHVHLREPGFLYKETVKSGTLAAAAGGFTDVFSMPNLAPCPDSVENLKPQLEAIEKDAAVRVYPYGAITVGEKGKRLADIKELAPHVIAFTDDGKGVASEEHMTRAMEEAASLGKLIAAHCEDENFPKESSQSEWKQLERDIKLVRKTGCGYHMCHVSTKESLELIREAKAEGLDITCETAPHYLTLTCNQAKDEGRFKMNPPLKSEADRAALIEGVRDGTVDIIATDHAPHSRDEKEGGFEKSAFGIVGLETAFPVLYTRLVLEGVISLEKLTELLYTAPRKRFGLGIRSLEEELLSDRPAFAVWNLDDEYAIEPEKFMSKGKSTPFEGWKVKGRCMMTVLDGKCIWKSEEGINAGI